jgi:DNA repair protein RecO (recombination protein O)
VTAPLSQPAYVLHARRYRDSSLLLDLLTRDQGRVSCVRRGALSARRGGPPLQPFAPLEVRLGGRGEVLSLLDAEAAGAMVALHGRQLYCGIYLNELLLKLTGRHDPSPGLFEDYAAALAGLAAGDEEPVLRSFEVALLRHLGLAPPFDLDSGGRPVQPASRYTFDPEHGASAAVPGAPGSVAGAVLIALAAGRLGDPALLPEARRLMRRVLEHHLDGRVLRSRELFR